MEILKPTIEKITLAILITSFLPLPVFFVGVLPLGLALANPTFLMSGGKFFVVFILIAFLISYLISCSIVKFLAKFQMTHVPLLFVILFTLPVIMGLLSVIRIPFLFSPFGSIINILIGVTVAAILFYLAVKFIPNFKISAYVIMAVLYVGVGIFSYYMDKYSSDIIYPPESFLKVTLIDGIIFFIIFIIYFLIKFSKKERTSNG